MRRTQLYLDDDLWKTLHERARAQGTTISALVRDAVRKQYAPNLEERRKAMEAFVGLRRRRFANVDAVEYVRKLREDDRLERLHKQWRSEE
ncbi:MAG TPA: ribbon-helix-helix protein, CopG family [Bryobacteraceae bacterium]|nr:ribbon-helix-helix protein, CopG family [Bryobacteraceae bacterium]